MVPARAVARGVVPPPFSQPLPPPRQRVTKAVVVAVVAVVQWGSRGPRDRRRRVVPRDRRGDPNQRRCCELEPRCRREEGEEEVGMDRGGAGAYVRREVRQ